MDAPRYEGLVFDPAEHKYTYKGMVIPGVTGCIEPFLPYWKLPQEQREAVLLRGTLVHELTAVFDRGEWDDSYEQDAGRASLIGYVNAWQNFLVDTNVFIEVIEARVFHTRLRFAGTLDRVARMDGPEGPLTLLEIKSGEDSPYYRLQTAAYCAAWNDSAGKSKPEQHIRKRLVIQLTAQGRYKIREHPAYPSHGWTADIDAFAHSVYMKTWRTANGL